MKEEARFQIRGRVERAYDKAVGQWQVVCLVLRVAAGKDGAEDEHEVNVWDKELKEVARRCQGRQALIVGRMRSQRNQNGYVNPKLSADAILVEPELPRAYGASAPAPAPAYDGRERAKGSGFTPAQVHEDMADEDIPF